MSETRSRHGADLGSIVTSERGQYRAVAFDLDGTLYDSGRPIPGALEAVARLRRAGLPLRFVTNTTSRCRSAIARRLRGLGFAVEDDEIVSPPRIAGELLRSSGASARLFVREATLPDFVGVAETSPPDWIVIGDLGADWTWAHLNDAFRALLEDGASLLALGRTRYWRDQGRMWLDVGPIVAALEYATGTTARVVGKPERAFFEAVIQDLGVPARDVLFVGDDIRTDVDAAQQAGMRGALVKTGKFRPDDLGLGVEPAMVLDSIADLSV